MDERITLKVAKPLNQNDSGLSRARMDSDSFRRLGIQRGDAVMIKGKREVVAKAMSLTDIQDEGQGLIRIDGLLRTAAGVSIDENVEVYACKPRIAESVVLAPNIQGDRKLKLEDGMEEIFRRNLLERPVMVGTDLIVPNVSVLGNSSTFKVVSTVPSGPVVVKASTKVHVKDSAERGNVSKTSGSRITYDDIGGLDGELRKIREMVEVPLKHPELFERLGISAPKGVLLYGPPGTGKTLIAEAVANESGARLFSVRGPEIIGAYYGESEERLRDLFKEASENTPSIIFLDEIDSIAPARGSTTHELEKRVVAQLLTLMDGLGDRGNVIVIGATNMEDSIDPALRRPGRFDREIEIGIPGHKARLDILRVHTRSMPLADDVDLEKLANITQGFVGADLAALSREAAMKCVRSNMNGLDLDAPIPREVIENLRVTMGDFMDAFAEVEPSGMREVLVEIPKVTWDDVGGLDDVRSQIEEAIVPEGGNEAYRRLGIVPAKGILLYGPPGTGKTLVAKAIANRSGMNFISVSGPEFISKWLGDSERNIRQVFKKAKQMAPCVVFFDEIDSIASARGSENTHLNGTIAQLLTSMDGVEGLDNVVVMAATNMPEMMDPALLRPGRFDRLILVGKPDAGARLNILKVHTKDMPLKDVDLCAIADSTDGYVGADLAALCREAALTAYREDHDAQDVTMAHFESALKEIQPSVTPETFQRYERMGGDMRKRRTKNTEPSFYG